MKNKPRHINAATRDIIFMYEYPHTNADRQHAKCFSELEQFCEAPPRCGALPTGTQVANIGTGWSGCVTSGISATAKGGTMLSLGGE